MLRNHFNSREQKDFVPINVVYELTLNKNKSIDCFYAPKIYLCFRTTIKKSKKGDNVLNHTHAKQCHYCNNYFVESDEKMKKHLACCSGKAGFTFSFDNGKIVDYQDHYRNLGGLPFSIYYDFETTTGSMVFFNAKMYMVSYCMVVAFHPDLKIPRLIIFRSYDQNENALTLLSHFQALEFNFFQDSENFNKTTLNQLEAPAFSVQSREKNTALAEMFSIELKFTTDCLKNWFGKKHKVLDLEIDIKKQNLFKRIHLKKKTLVAFVIFEWILEHKMGGLITFLEQNICF